jgi:hypothetical protein
MRGSKSLLRFEAETMQWHDMWWPHLGVSVWLPWLASGHARQIMRNFIPDLDISLASKFGRFIWPHLPSNPNTIEKVTG